MTRALQKHVARRQDQTFADWFAELRELAGERWADVADQAPTVYKMEVIQFPSAKDPLAFDGMGIEINVEEQRESWAATFMSVQTALRFCNFDHVKAEEMARDLIDEDGGWFIDESGSRWTESVEFSKMSLQ